MDILLSVPDIITTYLYKIFLSAGKTLVSLAPYLIAGVLASELLKKFKWKHLMRKINMIPSFISIPVSTILGMISPLCTYGTVPLVIRLLEQGVPPAPLIAFLAVSSMMNPQLFIITWAGLGPEIALVRLLLVFIFGIIAGSIVVLIPRAMIIRKGICQLIQKEKSCGEEISDKNRGMQFIRGFLKSLEYVGFYFLIGITLGAVIEHLIPAEYIMALFAPGRFMALFIASILSVPLYACGGGAIPLLRSLIGQGMSRSAAIAFLFVGPATRITPLAALASILRPVFLACYTAGVIIYAIVFGLVFPW